MKPDSELPDPTSGLTPDNTTTTEGDDTEARRRRALGWREIPINDHYALSEVLGDDDEAATN